MNSITAMVKELRQETGASFLDCKEALAAHGGDFDQAAAALRKKNAQKVMKKAERQTGDGLIVLGQDESAVCLVELNCETDFVALTSDFKALVHQLADRVLADETLADEEALNAATLPSGQAVQETIQALIAKLGENIKLGRVARYPRRDGAIVHGYVHAGAISGYAADEGRWGVLVEVSTGDHSVAAEGGEEVAHDLALHIASAAPKYISVEEIPEAALAAERTQLLAEVANQEKPAAIKERIVEGRLRKFVEGVSLLQQPFVKDEAMTVGDWLRVQSEETGADYAVARFVRAQVVE